MTRPDLDYALPGRPLNALTDVGFRMGSLEVVRVASVKGYSVIWVQTATRRYELIATPKGRGLSVKGPYQPVRHTTADGIEL